VPLDVKTNAVPFEGRVYVIVLDELHTSTHSSLLVRAAARRFIERHFGEGDLAAVVHTFGAASNSQGLTSDRNLLLAAVDKFVGNKLPVRDHVPRSTSTGGRSRPGSRAIPSTIPTT
jgi:hypothetical protein